MHNIKFIREHPEKFNDGMKKRGLDIKADYLLKIDESIRLTKHKLQEVQHKKNSIAQAIAEAKQQNSNLSVENLLREGEEIKKVIHELEKKLLEIEQKLYTYLTTLPNLPEDQVPLGCSENDNIEVMRHGNIVDFGFTPKQHFEIGERLKQLDFETAAKMSGSRFYIATKSIAKLARAVANLMLDVHITERGYTEISVPLLVRDSAMFGTGQLPKFAHDSFTVNNGEYRLIPTSEIALLNTVADSILPEDQLPLRLTAYTPCFRSEAGSAGKDTRGMIRLHQFYKVELVHICTPEQVAYEYEYMITSAEQILQRLELPYRKILLCSQDMGFNAQITYDLEVWLPGQKKYREISSCSNCGEFQAQRLKARFKCTNDGSNKFLHMTNGSALAIERTVAAILENYQQSDGSVIVPKALIQYMNGQESIVRIV